ncbi:hypothetical protein MnTg02_02474 [bacterium MnTg02]|nr:hypothetical protein MnTg02_02474 [bacterium MnTg02]
MSTIIQFRRVSKRTSHGSGEALRDRRIGSGDIIIFPGVRIERDGLLPDGTTPDRDARKKIHKNRHRRQ